jgi:hypothetical protein
VAVLTVLHASFADALIAHDLPGLPPARRERSVRFVVGRIAVMPGPTRLGVHVIAVAVATVLIVLGPARTARLLAPLTLPLLGEYVRLHRSLVYAYVWETWPDTAADGTPA